MLIAMAVAHKNKRVAMESPKIVSHDEWIEARTSFLWKKKEFTR